MWLPRDHTSTAEIEIRRSRFLAVLCRTDSQEAARTAVAGQRQAHPDARHHCSAFIVEVPGAQAIERSSDDGEPSGTAGMPMLEVLRGSGLTNVTVVVVRWFGGTKLGTGGLVRAYSDAVAAVVAGAPRVRPVSRTLHTLRLGHAEAGRLRAELGARGFEVVGAQYGADAVLTLAAADAAALHDAVAHLTHGTGRLVPAGSRVIELPV